MTIIYASYNRDTVEVLGFRPGGDVIIKRLGEDAEFDVHEDMLQEVEVKDE